MLFDSHAHFDDKRFNEDRDALLSSMKDNDVGLIMNVGADMNSSRASIKLANKYDFIYASVGVHPHDTEKMTEDNLVELADMTKERKVRAIGEIGLDYHYDNSPRDTQKYWFKKQMDLAHRLRLPVIIHDRESHQDCFDILKQKKVGQIGGVMHHFSGSVEMAREIVKLGMYISIAGPITFKNAVSSVQVVADIPIEHMLIETDSPYLTPEPNRGGRNSSLNVHYVAQKIAEIKGMKYADVCRITMDNAKMLFRIR